MNQGHFKKKAAAALISNDSTSYNEGFYLEDYELYNKGQANMYDEYSKFDSLQSGSNLTTLSPQKQIILRDDAKPRLLESQPRQSLGEPLQSNLDSQKRQRFGRPNTNSPFPYMQKRNAKSKQLPLPSTAATSNMNQLMVISEIPLTNGRLSGTNQNGQQDLFQSEGPNNNRSHFQKHQKNFGNHTSFQQNGNQENSSHIININQYQDNFSPFQSSFIKNGNFTYDEDELESSTFYEQQNEQQNLNYPNQGQIINKDSYNKRIHLNTNKNSEIQVKNNQFNRDQSQNTINQQREIKQNGAFKKRKLQTEPNSPSHIFSENYNNNFGGLHQQQQSHQRLMNNQIIIGKEMPIRLSGNKLQIIKASINQGNNSNSKHRQKKVHQESLYKLTNSLDENNILLHEMHQTNPNNRTEIIEAPLTQEKNSSFLPRLDANHRYSNSQVQYRDPNELNTSDFKDRDLSIRSPKNNYQNDLLGLSNKKSSFSHDRKNPSIQVNYNINDFNKAFKPQSNNIGKSSKQNKLNQSNFQLTNGGLFNEISPQNSHIKDFSELYSLKNGIGKVQPVPEIKTQFNEQVIRGKIYREKNLNSETPSKMDMSLISLTKSSNYHPISEMVSPKHMIESPLNFQFDHNKPVKLDQQINYTQVNNKHNSNQKNQQINQNGPNIRLLNISQLSEDFKTLTEKNESNTTQFHHRNFSISQGSQKIENVASSSKDQLQFVKSGKISVIDNQSQQSEDQPIDKKNQSIKNPSSFSGIDQSSTAQLSLQKQFHHTIKTVASKQMPKCFRMSKHQLQIINRQQGKGINTSTYANKMLLLENNTNKFEYTFVMQKQSNQQSNPRSMSNDARVSFNEAGTQYQTIQKAKADFQTPLRQSYKFNSNLFNDEGYNTTGKFQNEHIEIERDRMTPAFNARQSYNGRQE